VGVSETPKLVCSAFRHRFAFRSEHAHWRVRDGGVNFPAPTNALVEHFATGFRHEQHRNDEKPMVSALCGLARSGGCFETERLARLSRAETAFHWVRLGRVDCKRFLDCT